MKEIGISDQHSSYLTQVLGLLICLYRAVSLYARTRLKVLNRVLNQALHVLGLKLIKHWISRSEVTHYLEKSHLVFCVDSLTVGVDEGWNACFFAFRKLRVTFLQITK